MNMKLVAQVIRNHARDLELEVKENREFFTDEEADYYLEAARQMEALAEDLEVCG